MGAGEVSRQTLDRYSSASEYVRQTFASLLWPNMSVVPLMPAVAGIPERAAQTQSDRRTG